MPNVTKRNNSYLITVSLGYDIHGKQIRKTKTIIPPKNMTARQKEKYIQKEAILFEEQCRLGLVSDKRIKLETFLNEWIERKRKELKTRTIKGYVDLFPRINRALGYLYLDQIRPDHIMDFYSELEVTEKSGVHYKINIDLSKHLSKQKISKAEFSRRTGVPASTISSITRGNNCNEENAVKISNYFDKPLNNLFSPSKEKVYLSKNYIYNCYS